MKKEEKLVSVQSRLNDQDYEDVFRIYLENERGSERKIAMIVCAALSVICLALVFIMHNYTFLFYGIGCLLVGLAYLFVPVNKKFIATNRLMFGTARETGFYPHMITTMEIFEDEEAAEMTEEEIEEATTVFSTGNITAYENERGFLFAEGKITNQFLYIPKRDLTETETGTIRAFAEENCSGGYHLVGVKSMVEPDENETEAKPEKEESSDFVNSVCDQYYGAEKLRLHGDDGFDIDIEDGEEADGADAEEASEPAEDEESAAETAPEEPAEDAAPEETGAEEETTDEQ